MSEKEKRIIKILFICILPVILYGCWSIFGPEEDFIKPVVDKKELHDKWFWIVIGLSLINLFIRSTKKQSKKERTFFWLIILIQIGLAYTIVGTFWVWLYSAIYSWGTIGVIMLIVIFGVGAGFLKGWYGMFPIILYEIYHEPFLIMYIALPAIIADIVEALVRKKPEAVEGDKKIQGQESEPYKETQNHETD